MSQSITVPLKTIFEQSLKEKKFPEVWKKANIVPVNKKVDKDLIKNYRPISLLPIFSKVYEGVIYNALFSYFKDNKLCTPSQSGFLPGDSCIAQLLSIIHEIQTAFAVTSLSDFAVTSLSDFAPASSKEFLDIQATVECGFTLKSVRDMTRTYSQMHRTDKY